MKIEKKEREFANDLIEFIYKSPTAFHCVDTCREMLDEGGFERLHIAGEWDIKKGGKYYVEKNSSAIIAFTVNSENIEEEGFGIIGSHSDFPAIKIKPSPEMVQGEGYLKLNTEIYGGPILNTWMDRPLAVAGRVVTKGESPLRPKETLINIKRPVAVIPNLAIHMNREVNKGIELNRQIDMIPLVSTVGKKFEKEGFVKNIIADELEMDIESIIDFELYFYEYEKGMLCGLDSEFISSPRLDNLSMVHASLNALLDSRATRGASIVCVFDNEEVGSSTKQGADSPMLRNVMERICIGLGKDRDGFFRGMYNSFMISADLAHAVHPNKPEKSDPTSRPAVNGGPAIKLSANQSYTTDGLSASIYESICEGEKIPCQRFLNRSDERGGSTIGPISSTHLDIQSVDVGSPVLAMHSARELGGVKDHSMIYRSFVKFFEL